MDKSGLRKYMVEKRTQMSEEEVSKKSSRICQRVIYLREYQEADILLCYAGYHHEVRTTALLEDALKNGKRVALPRVDGKNMEFFYIRSLNDLKPGYRSILEPVTEEMVLQEEAAKAVMIIPGTSFDKQLNRNGYGGGYYDRYIQRYMPKCKIGIAFGFQVLEQIPQEAHDKKMDYIVSEVEIYGK